MPKFTRVYVILFVLLVESIGYGQTITLSNKKDTIIDKNQSCRAVLCSDLTINCHPYLEKYSLGFGWTVEARFGKRFFTGGNIGLYPNCNLNSSYGYATNKPKGDYGDLLWINEYRVIDEKILKINISVSNGFAEINLNDGEHSHYFKLTKVYNVLATNYFYSFQPGLNVMLDVFGKNSNAKLFLKSNYNFMFGSASFLKASDFNAFLFGIGIRGEFL